MKTMTVSRKLVLLARYIAKHIGSTSGPVPFTHTAELESLVDHMEAAVKQTRQLQKLGQRLASGTSPTAKTRLVDLYRDSYNSVRSTHARTTSAVDWIKKYYQAAGGEQGLTYTKPDPTPNILRQLMLLEKKYRGNIYFCPSPARITVVYNSVVSEYKREGKVIGRLAFHPIHIHYFLGCDPAAAFHGSVLVPPTSPDYKMLDEGCDWHSDRLYKSTSHPAGIVEIGLFHTNSPLSANSAKQPHPHIFNDGRVCQGEAAPFIGMALAEGRIYDAFMVIHDIMTDPKGVKDGCQDYHNILRFPHCEQGCVKCGEMCDASNPKAVGTNRAVHEKCVKNRCPDTGLPADVGDERWKYGEVWYHTSAMANCCMTGDPFPAKQGSRTSITGRLAHPRWTGTCAISGVVGVVVPGSPKYLDRYDDLIPWEDGKYVCAACLDMAYDPNKKESLNGTETEEPAALPVSPTAQWWRSFAVGRVFRNDKHFHGYYTGAI